MIQLLSLAIGFQPKLLASLKAVNSKKQNTSGDELLDILIYPEIIKILNNDPSPLLIVNLAF